MSASFGRNVRRWLGKVLALTLLLSISWPYAPYVLVSITDFLAESFTGQPQDSGIEAPAFAEVLAASWSWPVLTVSFVLSAAIVNTLSEHSHFGFGFEYPESHPQERRCHECDTPFLDTMGHRICDICRFEERRFKAAQAALGAELCGEFGCLRETTCPDGMCDLHAGSEVMEEAGPEIDSTDDLEAFKAIRSEWLEREMDPASCWLMPQILDVRVAETAAFHDAFEEAAGLLDSEDRVTNGDRFRSAVALMAERWALALAHAETVGATRFTAEQTRLTARMSSLHRLASRADAPPAEVQNARQAFGRAQAEWATSLGLPAKSGHAALALVSAGRRAIR